MSLMSRRRKHGRARSWNCSVSFNSLLNRLYISWETEVFNKPLFNWGLRHARYLKLWFVLGVGFGLSMMVMTFLLMLFGITSLLMNLWSGNAANESTQVSGPVLALVIPGVNVPLSDLPFLLLAIAIAVGFHELGHAIAAASEGVPIEHVAVFLACLVPGALVALNEESLQLLSPLRALRVYCAGIWHNVMCSAGCYLFLLLSQLIISPLIAVNQYPVVAKVGANSPLAGLLQPGDSIKSVGELQLQKPEDWFKFLHNHNKEELAHFHQTSVANVSADESHKVIKYIASQGFCNCSGTFPKGEIMLPGFICPDDALPFYQHSCNSTWPFNIQSLQEIHCLKAVDVIRCPPCSIKQNTRQSCICSGSSLCLLPLLSHGEVFVGMEVQQTSLKSCRVVPDDPTCERNMVFVGNRRVFSESLQLTKTLRQERGVLGFLSFLFWCLESLLMYTFSVSAAMALLNSALVFHLDGEQIFQATLALMKLWVPLRRHKRVMQIVLILGTILMGLFLICSCISLLF